MPKKNKLKKNSLIDQIIGVFQNNPYNAFNYKQIGSILGIHDSASKGLISVLLKELQQKKLIAEIKTGKYKLNIENISPSTSPQSYITGIVDMKNSGKAYIISEGREEDIYIDATNTCQALNGDKVKVFLFPKRKGRRTEGQITEIIERAKTKFVGHIETAKLISFFIPDSNSMPMDIFIPTNELNGAKNGDKVIAEITDWPKASKNPFGRVTDVLGKPGEHHVEMHAILAEYGFPLSFPNDVEAEAKSISSEISLEYNPILVRYVFIFKVDIMALKSFATGWYKTINL